MLQMLLKYIEMKNEKTFIAQFDNFEIELAEDVVKACYHQGSCDEDISCCLELPDVKAELSTISPELIKKELAEYGAWDETELNDNAANLSRILWIAAGNIQDEEYPFIKK